MQTFEECLLQYRQSLRQLLCEVGIVSNPGVTDDWILEQISKAVVSMSRQLVPDEIAVAVGDRHGWSMDGARRKIFRTREILGFESVEDAISFLTEALPGSGKRVVERIVEIARAAYLSPKTIQSQDDGGSCRSHASARATELITILNELPEKDRSETMEAAEQKYNSLPGPS